jgi:hypothetical protein
MYSRCGVSLPKGGLTEHTTTAFNHGPVPKLLVFGGWNGAYHTNELAVLSTDAPGAGGSDGLGWEPLTVTGRGPSPRSGHTATPLDDDGTSILFFGGEYSTVGRKCALPLASPPHPPPPSAPRNVRSCSRVCATG